MESKIAIIATAIIILVGLFLTAGYFIVKSLYDKKDSIIWDSSSYQNLKNKLISYDGSLKENPSILQSIINNFIKQNPNIKISDLDKLSTKNSIDKIIDDVKNRRISDPGPPISCNSKCSIYTKWTPEIFRDFKNVLIQQRLGPIKDSQINCIVNNIAARFESPDLLPTGQEADLFLEKMISDCMLDFPIRDPGPPF